MKRRYGHVSNSSSSSFMIGIGVLKNRKKFEKYTKERNITFNEGEGGNYWDGDLMLLTVNQIREMDSWCQPAKITQWGKKERIEVEAPVNSSPSVSITTEKLEDWDTIVVMIIGNDEGDGAFVNYDYEDDYYPDYDQVDYDWFDSKQQSMFDTFCEEAGIERAETYLGADRNG